jgi:histidyl-tRNA synthetase
MVYPPYETFLPEERQMTDQKKERIAEARLPRGLGDRGPDEIAATQRMLETIRATYQLYGFEAVETPLIEYTDALGKFLPDLDRPNEGVFSFKDDDEQWLSLRYDLTAPLARYVAENFDRLPKPYRSFRVGHVFRNEKPGPGRFRQFMQFDADTVGSASIAADAEMCMMAADTLEALGVKRGDYVIKVNNRKILDGVMEAIGLGGAENAGRRLTVLRAIDKFDRLGLAGVKQLLGLGRKDESGDFTKGAGLDAAGAEYVAGLFDPDKDPEDHLASMDIRLAQIPVGSAGVAELQAIQDLVSASGYRSDRIRIDPSVVRGLEYYTGPVFEAELTFEVKGDDGKPIRFGSVGGGGRYDGLVGRFRDDEVPATGFSIGVSRLYSALKAIQSPILAGATHRGPVVVLVLDKPEIARYQAMVTSLRQAGIAAELYLGSSGMNAQLKYADKRGAVCAVIQGSNERDHADGPQVVVRDLIRGAELAKMTKDRADYLELRAQAQRAVSESALVETIREVLARHA